MYRIGSFSKINKVTIKTLRYYDEIGLLKPAFVDQETGYRYYTSEQLPELHKIIALRQIGFSIDEISAILKGHNIAGIFEGRKSDFEIIPKIGEEMTAANPDLKCAEPAYCFIIYHDGEYKEKDIDVEFCEAVTSFGKEIGNIKFKKMERVPAAACVYHKGTYSTLGNAYAHVFKWIADNGYTPCEGPRESYIDGIWNKEDENDWLTELQVPVIKK